MNPITDIVFSLTWIFLLVWAVRSVISGARSQSVRNYNADTWTTEVTKRLHPEMIDVEPGEKLLGVSFDKKTSCDLDEYRANMRQHYFPERSNRYIDSEYDYYGDMDDYDSNRLRNRQLEISINDLYDDLIG